jgi:hypothetical protein
MLNDLVGGSPCHPPNWASLSKQARQQAYPFGGKRRRSVQVVEIMVASAPQCQVLVWLFGEGQHAVALETSLGLSIRVSWSASGGRNAFTNLRGGNRGDAVAGSSRRTAESLGIGG